MYNIRMDRITSWLKKYFIPHKDNDHKPYFLRHESVLAFFFALIIFEVAFLVQVFIVFDKTNFLASVLPGILTSLTNQERAQNNASPLAQNELLSKAATLKAQDMATKGYFAHTSPEGKTPWYWLTQVGYNYIMAGENLAVNFFESSDVAEAWMNSPTHRANIVKKDYTEIGIGVANGTYQGRSTVFVAQFFGTPIKIIPIETLPTPKGTGIPTSKNVGTAKPKPIPPKPVVTPPTIVAVAPVATKVLGEEADTPVVTNNASAFSNLKTLVQKVLTSPREYSTYAFGGAGLLVLLLLLLPEFIKFEIQHPKMLVRGVAVVVIIFSLLYVNIRVLDLEPNAGRDDVSANAIGRAHV